MMLHDARFHHVSAAVHFNHEHGSDTTLQNIGNPPTRLHSIITLKVTIDNIDIGLLVMVSRTAFLVLKRGEICGTEYVWWQVTTIKYLLNKVKLISWQWAELPGIELNTTCEETKLPALYRKGDNVQHQHGEMNLTNNESYIHFTSETNVCTFTEQDGGANFWSVSDACRHGTARPQAVDGDNLQIQTTAERRRSSSTETGRGVKQFTTVRKRVPQGFEPCNEPADSIKSGNITIQARVRFSRTAQHASVNTGV